MNLKVSDLKSSHPIELEMGILYYATKTDGIGGKIRFSPKDFKVEEILPDGRIIKFDDNDFSFGDNEPGLFTEFVLKKRNIESHSALYKITKALNRDILDINISGTKDKTAHTAQRATIWRVPPEELLRLQIKGITIQSPRITIYKTYLGNLKGNFFTIKIRETDLTQEELDQKLDSINQETIEFKGIPNFFGHQRFGTRRPISHIIGKHILKRNYEEAIRLYLSFLSTDENEITKEARIIFEKTNDPEGSLKIMPKSMVFERLILKHLTKYPNDYKGSFLVLPKNMQRIFIHAYQSYIWNRTLSKRIALFGNLEKQNIDFIDQEKIVLPIIGYNTKKIDNEIMQFAFDLLQEDNISQEYFKLKDLPTLKFNGSNRSIKIDFNDFNCNIAKDTKNNNVVTMKFSLSSGSYATIIIREFMKTTPLSY
ncbi:MAG: tRNA pseudouridine(13) synthase TruD [Asgard group archaeon]|nr:tRNA pseudouridine(13) synthase TruD [Asgard group archaeon]